MLLNYRGWNMKDTALAIHSNYTHGTFRFSKTIQCCNKGEVR